MAQELELRREIELPATPEQVWEAIATGPGNLRWLFPMEIEPWVGGMVSRGPSTVAVWDPPQHFSSRYQNETFSHGLDYFIEARDDDSTVLRTVIRWAESGTFDDGWAIWNDAADKHGEFYQHTLGQYLRYFVGCPATYVQVEQPDAAKADAFIVLRRALGLTEDVAAGDSVHVVLPGFDPLDAMLDYLSPHFIGLRTADGLYRFFGRNNWGWPIRVGHHLFAEDVDQEKAEHAWHVWLDGIFA
jgi:uncharacterized protein YndB with AHSA1/START domain